MEPGSQPNGEISELERRLLEAARRDRVPDSLRTRMAEGLGVHVAGAVLQGGLTAAGKLGAPLFAKPALWGVLSLALVAAAVAGWRATRPVPRADRTAPAMHASSPAIGAPSITPAPADDDAALRAEIALLDRARKALGDGASARALQLLDEHRERFARAQLAPEASALRIEALVQRGSHEQAESLSRQFVSAYPTHPLAERVAKLAPP